MVLKTERLELVCLDAGQLALLVNDLGTLEKELKCTYMGEPMESGFLDIVKKQLEITEEDPENYVWHSFILIIRKADRVVVGSADFKNLPDEKGEVEIGYGLGKQFEKNGYMTETVKAMCDWALSVESVKHVIAETDIHNSASQNILRRSGFVEVERAESIWWRL